MARKTIRDSFLEFYTQNPWVYHELVRLARELKSQGYGKCAIGMLWEVVRWTHMRTTTDPTSGFKLNNNYRSWYARTIMHYESDLAGFFETRELRSP